MERILSLDRRGILTRMDRNGMIIDCVLAPDFFDCFAELPADVQDDLREEAAHPLAHPEDACQFLTGCLAPMSEEERDANLLRGRAVAYWSSRVLFEHFHPGQPLPVFEPIRRLGAVSESALIDGSVVVYGIQPFWLIRKNPLRCCPPDGLPIVTFAHYEFESSPPSPLDDGRENQRTRPRLHLAPNVRSPSDVPPGTTMYVDRSAAAEIPPLESVLNW